MVPVYTSAALVFGLIFILLARAYAPASDTGGSMAGKSSGIITIHACEAKDGGEKESLDQCQVIQLADTKLTIRGMPVGFGIGNEGAKDVANLAMGFFGSLFLNILVLIVLWVAVMAALKSNDITSSAVQPIADFGDQIGKLMKDLPKYAPIIPVKGNDGKTHMMGMG